MPDIEFQAFRDDLKKAKCKLYHAILQMPNDYLEQSEPDLDLMGVLSKDPQIREILNAKLRPNAAA